jgi:hypothetical protein
MISRGELNTLAAEIRVVSLRIGHAMRLCDAFAGHEAETQKHVLNDATEIAKRAIDLAEKLSKDALA